MEISRDHIVTWLRNLQDTICLALENADGRNKFREDNWTRPEGGGGRTRIITDGAVIEKGGVLFSAVSGETPDFLLKEKQHSAVSDPAKNVKPRFFATGVSIVIHPVNPLVPIIHMNIRYFEMDDGTRWLGGGIDLTPHYINEHDARYFHTELKKMCERHNGNYYAEFKKWADDYFFIRHRNETRGIGGIFFDRLNEAPGMLFSQNLEFWKDVGSFFAPVYCELVRRNRDRPFTGDQKQWQLLRRGRYVEFNLVYDKGTKFGLETNGRTESILMSLPKLASWEYDYRPAGNSEEEKTQNLLKKGIDWTS
jgi:coproporphyrinogen III oxidase